MYKIIGSDQREYGPVSGDQLRQWVAEGRVNGQTMARAESDLTWKPLAQFPEFAGAFPGASSPYGAPPSAAAAPAFSTVDGRSHALQLIAGPAIGLMVTAGLGILYALFSIFMVAVGDQSGRLEEISRRYSLSPQTVQILEFTSGPAGMALRAVGILICLFILYGAIRMKKLQSYGLCTSVSILVMVPCLSPCLSPCCVLGIPMGIWALVMLNRPDIRSQFT